MREPRSVVLVEGVSDQRALEALAVRRGLDLAAERIVIVPMGGATNIHSYLTRLGLPQRGVRLAGLCDVGEEADFRRGLERAGVEPGPDRAGLEALGFYVCVRDLEDELIRALGPDAVEDVVAAQGELGSFRTLQKQAPWRGRATDEQLRRFVGTRAGRKAAYARLLVEALDLTRIPRPLDRVLTHATTQ